MSENSTRLAGFGAGWPTSAGITLPRLSPAIWFALLYLIAVALNLCFGFATGFRGALSELEADEQEYYGLMQQILAGTVEIGGRRTLGFPLVLAAIHSINPSLLFLQIVICCLYSLSPPILFLIARKLSGSTGIGLLAGLALALWPPAIYFGTSLYSETLALPIFLLSLYLLPLANGEDRSGWLLATLAAGIALGLATHIRPMYLIALPFLCLVILIETWKLKPAFLRALVLIAGFLIVILPWSITVSARYDQPVLVTSAAGETLGGGLNPKLLEIPDGAAFDAPGRRTWVGPGKWLPIHENGYLTAEEMKLPFHEMDPLLRSRTVEWVIANPGDALYIQFRKLTYMWGIYPFLEIGVKQALFGNVPTILMLIAGIGFFIAARGEERRRLARLWILPLFVSAVALISWGSWRFRQPGDAGLLAFCAICGAQLFLARYGRGHAHRRSTAQPGVRRPSASP